MLKKVKALKNDFSFRQVVRPDGKKKGLSGNCPNSPSRAALAAEKDHFSLFITQLPTFFPMAVMIFWNPSKVTALVL